MGYITLVSKLVKNRVFTSRVYARSGTCDEKSNCKKLRMSMIDDNVI